jgi:predicted ATPase
MVTSLLDTEDIDCDLEDLILEKTEGVPFFIEELIKSLKDLKIIERKDNRYRITKDIKAMTIPAMIQDVIMARVDTLPEGTKGLLQTVSAVGREFNYDLIKRVTGLAEQELLSHLSGLKDSELLYERGIYPQSTYIFKHALTQEVAYDSLLLKRKKEIHEEIGKAIEALHPDRLEEQAPILAYHYIRSDRQDKAIEYALLAGDQAAGLYANTEATTYYEQAFTMSQSLPESPKVQQWQIDAALKLAAVGITRQDIKRDRTNLEQAHSLAEALNDEPRLAQVLYWLGRIHYVLWSPQIAMGYAKQSLMIADRLGDDALAASPVNLMGRVYYQLSDFVQASQFLERSVEQMRRIGNKVEESTASALAGYVLAFLGEFERAFVHADHAIQLAQEIQNPFTKANAYHLRGSICDQRGEWTQAIKDYEKAIRIAEKAEDLFRLYLVKSWKGRARAMIGDPGRGRELLEESLALAEKIGTKFWLAWQKTALAACLFILGELETGSQLCQEAIHLGEETNDKYVIAFANRTFAEIFSSLEPSDPQKADRAILKAIQIQQEIDVKPELTRSYVSYTHLLTSRGEKETAKEYLAKAIGMFQQMGMTWDLAQADQLHRNLRI